MTPATPQLEYAPGAPIRRRRRMRRVMGLLLLAIVAGAAWWFHAPLWQHAKLLYYQRQCLNYTARPEQVVYDENNGTVSPLIGTAGYRGVLDWSSFHSKRSGMFPPSVAVRPAPELAMYWNGANAWTLWPPATIFLHELRTKSGLVRLVAVTRSPAEAGYITYEFGLTPLVIIPAGLSSGTYG